MNRRDFLLGTASIIATSALPVRMANASDAISILEAELISGRACGSNAAAIRGTLERLTRSTPPGAGRTIVVDIPSQHLGAYDDGYLSLESRVVVGDASWKTPDLDTKITFIRYNPTWTVPESIIKARSWRKKLAEDPGYFTRLNFKMALDGEMVSPDIAASHASRVGSFVQQPGPGNALGQVKLGLAHGDAIYLHDTNDQAAFDENQRALSHGCIRVEEAIPVSAWALGIDISEAYALIDADDRRDRKDLPSPVRMVTTYFTAWPDANGNILYYPDPYGKDASDGACDGTQPTTGAWGSSYEVIEADQGYPSEVIIYAN